MDAKTLTTIGRLQIGDRFYFTGNKKEVQQLISMNRNVAVYNKVLAGEPASGTCFLNRTGLNREVIFLRHTNAIIKTI